MFSISIAFYLNRVIRVGLVTRGNSSFGLAGDRLSFVSTALAKEMVMKVQAALFMVGGFVFVVGCSGSSSDDVLQGSSSDRLVLDVRCSSDADCPTGFECEIEEEHGVSTSFCTSHGGGSSASDSGTGGVCPPGFEQELEHGGIFCKAHGGKDDGASGASGSGASTCTTDADCGAGFECEVETEHGVTTSTCKPHGK